MLRKFIGRRNRFIGACTFISIAMGVCTCAPPANWVSGAARITVTKVTFTGQQRSAECTSAEIIDYLNKCLARPRVIHDERFLPYRCDVVASDGTAFVISASVGFTGMLGVRTSEAEDYIYGVDRVSPIPASYTALMTFLSDPKQKPGASAKF